MKFRIQAVIITAALFFAACPIPVRAQVVADPGPTNKKLAEKELIPTLEDCYATLAKADRDYGGHRALAQARIGDACKLLGTAMTSQAGGGEAQKSSNLQLMSVQMTLLSVGRSIPDKGAKPQVLDQLNRAIRQISLGIQYEMEHGEKPSAVGPGLKALVVGTDPIGGNSVEIASLEEIYKTMALADHDYKGHRIKAMAAIKRASKVLGGDISGDGKGGVSQAASDADMHDAHKLLRQVRDSFAIADPKKALTDLEEALKEMNEAPAVK